MGLHAGFDRFGDDFTKFPNMGYFILIEANFVYGCKVCYSFLA